MDFQIAPGAALNDPRLREAVAARVGRKIGRDDALRIQNILAHWPWREYGYKFGRWQAVDTLFSQLTGGKKWGQVFAAFALVDLSTGREVGEMTSFDINSVKLARYSGRLWFAGEPTVAGVYSPAGDGVRELRFMRSPFLQLKPVNEHAMVMRPGARPELPRSVPGLNPRFTYDPNNRYRDDRHVVQTGPWVVDHPNEPPKSELRG